MQSIGLTVEEMAMVYVALPLTTFLSPPVTGRQTTDLSLSLPPEDFV